MSKSHIHGQWVLSKDDKLSPKAAKVGIFEGWPDHPESVRSAMDKTFMRFTR
ncbi:MAG: hypothetical protein OXE78_12675 [Gammaproteobacteria bacterium]|nr:hypothetical protein [Gammaproteobacteria bacterium]MCY4358802.1 hypothetical protein [Gammaproteobacteria bacterium]